MSGIVIDSTYGGWSPGGAWTPASSADRLWLRADLGITLDGSSNVQQWNDQSPRANHATQASAGARPAMTTLGGQSAVAGNVNMFLQSATSIFATAGSARTVIVVCHDSSNYPPICERTTDPCQYFGNASSTIVCGDETNGAQNITLHTAPNLTPARWMLYSMTGAGNTPTIIHKATGDSSPTVATIDSGVQGTESGSAGYFVGKSGFGAYYVGAIAEIICAAHAFSGSEISGAEAYLASRYGI